ncbi:MAG: hypothetical protein MUC34_09120 [Anaerolineae bacterium]|nr:hypothetical protein [Anaerolineae bacterium]
MADMRICASNERAARLACARSPAYFLDHYASIYDSVSRDWTRFALWPAQVTALDAIESSRRTVILKARQLGASWLCVGYALWLMLFRPAATVLLFSRRDEEAVHLLNFRLRGMLERLPESLAGIGPERDSAHELRLANGSLALAFPTTGGRSYSATLALVDEADYAGDLDALLNAVKPTVDAGGAAPTLRSSASTAQPSAARTVGPRSSSLGTRTPTVRPSGTPRRRSTSARAPAASMTSTRNTPRTHSRRSRRVRKTNSFRRNGCAPVGRRQVRKQKGERTRPPSPACASIGRPTQAAITSSARTPPRATPTATSPPRWFSIAQRANRSPRSASVATPPSSPRISTRSAGTTTTHPSWWSATTTATP